MACMSTDWMIQSEIGILAFEGCIGVGSNVASPSMKELKRKLSLIKVRRDVRVFAVAGADQDSGLQVLTRAASDHQRGMASVMGFEVLRRGVVWSERKDLMADRCMGA
jgi:hypothetical protein